MRRFYSTILIAILALTTSCQLSSEDERDASKLGKAIWSEAKLDIEFTLDAIVDVLNVDYLLSMDDEKAQADVFASLYGLDKELVCADAPTGTYQIITRNATTGIVTNRTTYITHKTPLGEGKWEVKRESGDYYEITFTPDNDGRIKAKYNTLSYIESTGDAELVFFSKCSLSEGVPSFRVSYEGYIELVDPVMSKSRPLTLTTKTSNISHYSSGRGIIQSNFDITCKDEYYDVTDKISVMVIYNTQRSVTITCYGESDTYTM